MTVEWLLFEVELPSLRQNNISVKKQVWQRDTLYLATLKYKRRKNLSLFGIEGGMVLCLQISCKKKIINTLWRWLKITLQLNIMYVWWSWSVSYHYLTIFITTTLMAHSKLDEICKCRRGPPLQKKVEIQNLQFLLNISD